MFHVERPSRRQAELGALTHDSTNASPRTPARARARDSNPNQSPDPEPPNPEPDPANPTPNRLSHTRIRY
jgi:hypothetical protein